MLLLSFGGTAALLARKCDFESLRQLSTHPLGDDINVTSLYLDGPPGGDQSI